MSTSTVKKNPYGMGNVLIAIWENTEPYEYDAIVIGAFKPDYKLYPELEEHRESKVKAWCIAHDKNYKEVRWVHLHVGDCVEPKR